MRALGLAMVLGACGIKAGIQGREALDVTCVGFCTVAAGEELAREKAVEAKR